MSPGEGETCTYLYLYFPLLAGDGVLSAGKRHAASKGAAGTEDKTDSSQHPAAAGGAETHPRAAAESPGTRHTGRMQTQTSEWLTRLQHV